VCLELVLNFLETWGDQHYIGLTSVEVLGENGMVIGLDMSMIDAVPRDLHHLTGHEQDDRTLDKSVSICSSLQSLVCICMLLVMLVHTGKTQITCICFL